MTVILTKPQPWAFVGVGRPPSMVDYTEHGRAVQTVRVAPGVPLPAVGSILAIGCGHVRVEAAWDRSVSVIVFPDDEVDGPFVARWRLVPVGRDMQLAPER